MDCGVALGCSPSSQARPVIIRRTASPPMMTVPERKSLIRNFVEGIEVVGDEATLTYTVPMLSDGARFQ